MINVIENFLSIEEETNLLQWMENPERNNYQDSSMRNSIRRFGTKTPYAIGNISQEIPKELQYLSEKLVKQNYLPSLPRSVSVNEYLPGQSISPHIDSKHSGPIIAIISLESKAIMRFSYKKEPSFDIVLNPRSLIIMFGEIREKWMHEILPVEKTRYSIVFRCI